MRTAGVEEEFLLVDPATGATRPEGPLLAARSGEQTELQRQQVETGSAPHRALADVHADLAARRDALAGAARGAGALLLALGTHPLPTEPVLTPAPRYEQIGARFGLLAHEQLTCGTHVHVAVADRDEGAAVLDRVRIWTAPLLALSANSPFWQGRDTGHASYRARVWDRWPTAGPTGAVGDAAGYDALVARELATGVPLDAGMLYFDVRLSAAHPTIEVRVADACLRVEDAVLLAALVRALVDTAARDAERARPVPGAGVEELRLAAWRAAHDGLGGVLVSPRTGRPAPAAQVVGELLEHVGDALRENGDADFVGSAVPVLLHRGTGADWQRRTLDEHGPLGMLHRAAALTAPTA